MSLTCNFCNKIFANVSSLNYHKDTAKYCLKIQGKNESEKSFKCRICNRSFTSKNNLNIHLESCEVYFHTIIEPKNKEISYLKEELQKYKFSLEQTKEMLDKANNTIAEIAKQPKNNTTNIRGNQNTQNTTNNILQNVLADHKTYEEYTNKERIKSIAKSIDMEPYFWKGQKGIASFCNDNIIKAPEKPLMSCTDTTRYRFKHLDEKGQVVEDIEARNFTAKVAQPIKEVAEELHDGIQKDIEEKMKEKEVDHSYLEAKRTLAMQNLIGIRDIDDNNRNTEFKKEMSILVNS